MGGTIDKSVVLTGAGSGIGLAIARRLAEAGMSLTLVGRRKGKLETALRAIEKAGGRGVVVAGDAGAEADARRAVRAALRDFGRIDALINNAGSGIYGPLETFSLKNYRDVLHSTLTTAFVMTRAVYPHMVRRREGHIVNITSLAGVKGVAYHAAYCAAKFGLTGFGQAVAAEGEAYNVRVTNIAPGAVNTPFWNDKASWRPPRDMMIEPNLIAEWTLHTLALPPTVLLDELVVRPNYCYKMAKESLETEKQKGTAEKSRLPKPRPE